MRPTPLPPSRWTQSRLSHPIEATQRPPSKGSTQGGLVLPSSPDMRQTFDHGWELANSTKLLNSVAEHNPLSHRITKDSTVLLVKAVLTSYVAAALSLVVHEFGHVPPAVFQGIEIQDVTLSVLLGDGSVMYRSSPALSASTPLEVALSFAGGPLASVGLGLLTFLAVNRSSQIRRRLLAPFLVAWCLGPIFVGVVGVFGFGADFGDLNHICSALNVSIESIGWIVAPLGLLGCVATGVWFLGVILEWSARFLPSSTVQERFWAIVTVGWLPTLIVVGISVSMKLSRSTATSATVMVALVVFFALSLAVVAILARRPGTRSRVEPVEASSSVGIKSVVGPAMLAVFCAVALVGIDQAWEPESPWSKEELARAIGANPLHANVWVEPPGDAAEIAHEVSRNPDDPTTLRRAAMWSSLIGRHEDCRAYRKRAVQIAPDDAGAIFDLALSFRATGRLEEALGLLERVARLRPDLEAVPASMATIQQELSMYGEAAASWRLAVKLALKRRPVGEDREEFVRIALDQARVLREVAAEIEAPHVSTDSLSIDSEHDKH